MSASIEIFGNRAGSPGPDGPASGYLLRTGSATILIDCGPGVLAGLARADVVKDLDAVIISHRHADHSADLPAFGYHQSFPTVQPRLPMFAPVGFSDYIAALDDVHGIPTLETMRTPLATQFDLHEVEPGDSLTVAGVRLDTILAQHPVPCLSMRFPDQGLVYTADTAKTPELVELSRGAELLLAEATYVSPEGHDFAAHGHMSGFEAGELAQEAGVSRLVLTHMEDFKLAAQTLANAALRFSGPIDIAWVGERFAL